MVPVILQLYL